jgi:hypothetical protein
MSTNKYIFVNSVYYSLILLYSLCTCSLPGVQLYPVLDGIVPILI